MSVVKKLYKNYGDFNLHIDEFEILDSGVTALVGPSGSGKTSCLRILLGLEPCPDLIWQYQNLELHKFSPPDKHIGVVFQSYEIFPHLSGFENIEFAARARKMHRTEYQQRLKHLAQSLDLNRFASRSGHLLSGGEKQRVALARALITKPRFLFLDEPFASLDVPLRESARSLVKSVVASEGIPTLLVTHDEEDLRVLAKHVVEIQNGALKIG